MFSLTHAHTHTHPHTHSYSEEGGHPDGSPLLRLTDKQHATKKSRASAAVLYHETPEEGSTGDYYGGGQHGNRTFMIFSRSPSAYGEGSSTSAHKTESAVFLGTRGKKAGAGGAAGGLAASSSSAGIYQDYGQAYAFPLYDDDPSYMSVSVIRMGMFVHSAH